MMKTTPKRRAFLKGVLGGGLAAAGAHAANRPGGSKRLPAVPLGAKQLSRLIAGGNPMRGFSHSSKRLSQHMLEYFTAERITEFLLRCEQEGITTYQSSYSETVRDGILGARERGSKIQFICLSSGKHADLKNVLALDPIAICHHGGVTDSLFRAGQRDKVHDYIKKVHDAGVLAGVSTHNPDNVAIVEDAGWENDLYMTCFYNMARSDDEIKALLGEQVLGEVFVASDPQRMTERIRQVTKPCLGFKILAAGRLSEDKESLERCFAFAYSKIKPTDAVIVGMYPVFSDEIQEDAGLASKYATAT
jgi:hypothetical protein